MKRSTLVMCSMVLLFSGGVHAHGDVACAEPKSEWRPSVELQKQLKASGWSVRKIKESNGCYEVYGFDENEKRVEAFFNPRTFERVL